MELLKIRRKYLDLSEEELMEFSTELRHQVKIEKSANGELIFMSPSFPHVSIFIAQLITELSLWNRQQNNGLVTDSSAGFTLPNGAVRAPDAGWISKTRWQKAMEDPQNKKRFPHVTPEFVIEVRYSSDTLKSQQEKMQEWIENEVTLGWLFDLQNHKTFIYYQQHVTVKNFSESLHSESVLPGFRLNLEESGFSD